MNRAPTRILVMMFLVVACFTLAAVVQTRVAGWKRGAEAGGVLKVLLGDSKRLFANHFFIKADVYFHSGYYPSIFDQAQAPKDSRHMTSSEGSPEAEEHEKKMNFLRPPRDWIERFGRHFQITDHTHLEGGGEREILPWLRIAAELDPQRIETYTVAAYWLRSRLGKVEEAEQFLREGLRNNPSSYEILTELGQLYLDNLHDVVRARNVWELGLRRWKEQQTGKASSDWFTYEKLVINLARLEEKSSRWEGAIKYLEMASQVSPHPEALREQIAELKKKLPGSQANPAAP